MSTTAAKTRPAYDPRRQWGLKPEGPAGVARGTDGEATYVLGGFVASSARDAPGLVGESMGREGQARARRRGKKREDEALTALLNKSNRAMNTEDYQGEEEDCGSTPVSRDALEVVRRAKEAMKQKQKQVSEKVKKKKNQPEDDSVTSDDEAPVHEELHPKKMYSAEMIKRLGFNPLANAHSSQSGRGTQQKPKIKDAHGKVNGNVGTDRTVTYMNVSLAWW